MFDCTHRIPFLPIHQAIKLERSTNEMESSHFASFDIDTGAWQSRARSIAPLGMLLGLAILLLVSCSNPVSTQDTTTQRTATSSNLPLSATPSPQLTQQYEFTEHDSGKTLTYTITSRFGISLNQQMYPKENIRLSCTPPVVLGSITNVPAVMPPFYAVRYEAVQPGLCTIKNGTFLRTVRVIDAQGR